MLTLESEIELSSTFLGIPSDSLLSQMCTHNLLVDFSYLRVIYNKGYRLLSFYDECGSSFQNLPLQNLCTSKILFNKKNSMPFQFIVDTYVLCYSAI